MGCLYSKENTKLVNVSSVEQKYTESQISNKIDYNGRFLTIKENY